MNPADPDTPTPDPKSSQPDPALHILEAQLEAMRVRNKLDERKKNSRAGSIALLIILVVLLIASSFILDFVKDFILAQKPRTEPGQIQQP